MKNTKRATLFLMLGMFFNPFGFDMIQIALISLTGSYYRANMVLYLLTVICFSLYFIYSGNNPIIEIKNIVLAVYHDKIKKGLKLFQKK